MFSIQRQIRRLTPLPDNRFFTRKSAWRRAAIENAATLSAAIASGDKRSGLADAPWQKIKVDRQIVAIAKSRRVKLIYSIDSDIATLAKQAGMEVCHLAEIPVPDDDRPLFRLLNET